MVNDYQPKDKIYLALGYTDLQHLVRGCVD